MSRAKCQLLPRIVANSNVSGVIHIEELEQPGHVNVYGTISSLTEGKHAFHIHEFGDTTGGHCMFLGGHYNPLNKSHGFLLVMIIS